ncbi:uncharacterized protein si:ch211-160b11.4 [Nothobranchius furzeri]|uniref:Asialoglycoprotein receptor 1-like n=3 Tax=Nothobranchius TaxID=28779 RepID=A0A8C6PIS4_NOTFU|nr:asialoglycoprotein receptor 1 [Nothobranchius furzeri]KAF7215583.1 asialoglycoprotein receptor 1-like [Nothobranchius furzeri]
MKTLVLFSLGLSVALGKPMLTPDVDQPPAVRGDAQSPVLGDLVPEQGHVVVKDPGPQVNLNSRELQEKPAAVAEKMEVKAEPEVKMDDQVKAEQELEPVEGEVEVEPDKEIDLHTDADFKVESEVLFDSEKGKYEPVTENDDEEEEDLVEKKKDFQEGEPEMMVMEPQKVPQLVNYFSDKETVMEMSSREDHSPTEDKGLQINVGQQQALMRGNATSSGGRYCTGTFTGGTCYQFFKEAKTHGDAEMFCQEQFPGGHLTSIPNQNIHMHLMSLILKENGAYTRTWMGGLRLDSHRFIWMDGSPWSYDDWLPGEPNDTAGVEDCVEVLGNGKFNDFTCWEPQAFICSFPLDTCAGKSVTSCLSA